MTDLTTQIIDLIDNKENTVTETTAAPVPYTIAREGEAHLSRYEDNAVILRDLTGHTLGHNDDDLIYTAGYHLGWWIATQERASGILNRRQIEGEEKERERIRTLLIDYMREAGYDDDIPVLLTRLSMKPMTYTYDVAVYYTGGWQRRRVAEFTFTSTEELDEYTISDRVLESISLEEPDLYIPMSINIGPEQLGANSNGIDFYEDIEVPFDVSDEYSNFEVEVTFHA